MSKTYHSRFFVQIDANRSDPVNCYSDEHDEYLHSGHPVGKKWPVIYRISAQFSLSCWFRGPSFGPTPACHHSAQIAHPMFPPITVVEGCIQKPVPNPCGTNIWTHSWNVGLWPWKLPAAWPERHRKLKKWKKGVWAGCLGRSWANIYGSSVGWLETHKNVNTTYLLFILEGIKIA